MEAKWLAALGVGGLLFAGYEVSVSNNHPVVEIGTDWFGGDATFSAKDQTMEFAHVGQRFRLRPAMPQGDPDMCAVNISDVSYPSPAEILAKATEYTKHFPGKQATVLEVPVGTNVNLGDKHFRCAAASEPLNKENITVAKLKELKTSPARLVPVK